jgi:hypothetical protein
VRRGDLVQRTIGVCVVVAAATLVVSVAIGRPLAGVALAAGLLIGSVNGWLAQKSLRMDAGFRATSLGRMAVLTTAGLGVGLLLGLPNVPLTIIGLAIAQLLLAGMAARAALETTRG